MAKTLLMSGGDILYGEDGAPVEIEGIDAADQLLGEELLLPFDPVNNAGNKLISQARGDDPTPIISKAAVSSELSAVVGRLQAVQAEDPYLTAEEQIDGIAQLVVIVVPEKKTDINFFLDVRVASNKVIKVRKALAANQFPGQLPASNRTRFGGP